MILLASEVEELSLSRQKSLSPKNDGSIVSVNICLLLTDAINNIIVSCLMNTVNIMLILK